MLARITAPDLCCCAQGSFVQTSPGVPRKRDSLGVDYLDYLDNLSWDELEHERNDVRRSNDGV